MLQIQRTPHLSCTSDEVFISLNHTPYTSNHSEFITGRITSPLNEINPSHSTDIVFIPWATTLDRFLYKSVEDVATSVNIMIRYGGKSSLFITSSRSFLLISHCILVPDDDQ
ncbi:hypothetical protein ABKN59_007627 [Abortiporus biennis]